MILKEFDRLTKRSVEQPNAIASFLAMTNNGKLT
ncbi:hypothetical protein SAMN05216269_10661 [Flavobacterium xinjiangense]|jgi:hypothetical protein|uniref:Uncharacterized protein n=1 Tax=Flavobacterium xinjiangense TaxID=178356 RepID=A0A1M7KRP9_9FLAO|nr:hypothetical protein SAMN05216269_10661 [Flavobacterium xinjiangense]